MMCWENFELLIFYPSAQPCTDSLWNLIIFAVNCGNKNLKGFVFKILSDVFMNNNNVINETLLCR